MTEPDIADVKAQAVADLQSRVAALTAKKQVRKVRVRGVDFHEATF